MIKQPVGQVKLTNVALIKYKVNNRKFEIACYRNKAINYRNGIEKDIEEVVQSHIIYSNANQGQQASKEELEKFFPNMKFMDIMKLILEKGDLQITDKERDYQSELIFKDIANLIAERCCHPISKRPYAVESIKAAMKKIHFPVKLDQNAKKQASDCIKKLQEKFIIARAEMKIALHISKKNEKNLIEELKNIQVVSSDKSEEQEKITLICLIEPSKFRNVEEILKNKLQDGNMEILIPYVLNKEVADIEGAGAIELQIREDAKFDEKDEEEKQEDSDDGEQKSKTTQSKKEKGKKKHDKDKKNKGDKQSNKVDGNKEKASVIISDIQKAIEKDKEKDNMKNDISEKLAIDDKKFKCNSCVNAAFDSNAEFRNHFKSEWHNFNLKRKMEKKPGVDEQEFKNYVFDKEFEKSK